MARGSRESTDVKYLEALIGHPDPVMTSTEVADELDISQQAAYDKLKQLSDRDLVRSKKTGSRSRVWWVTTQGRDHYRELTR